MGERTSYEDGTFCWIELGTDDPHGSARFYSAIFGWEAEEIEGAGHGVYLMMRLGGRKVAGILERGDKQPVNAWNSYVAVDDADVTAQRVSEVGGQIAAGPFTIESAGRMAFLVDPTGAALGLWQAGEHFGAEMVNDPGSLTVNQLNTGDPAAAEKFYSALFGWRFEQPSPDPEPYWSMYRTEEETSLNAGMMPLPEGAPYPAHWLPYITVTDADATAAAIREQGGEIELEPMDLPAGGRIAVALDPQGAAFALFAGQVDP